MKKERTIKIMKQTDYIKKKGKIKTAIAACLATMIFGGAVGFGSSQLLIGIMEATNAYQRMAGSQGESPSDSLNRDNLPAVLNPDSEEKTVNTETSVITPGSSGSEYTAAELFEKLSDTIVGIKVGSRPDDIIGSGVMISEEGFIITCAHVVDGADKVVVVVDDYKNPKKQHEYDAIVFGSDAPTDLAVIKVERKEAFRFAAIGGSSELKVGQAVVAIGNPLGLEKTITQGIVSGLQRDLGENPYMIPSIQTDAALNPGNSGGPLFDMSGNVVGIVNIKLVYGSQLDNLGFAISIDEARPVIEDLAENGNVTTRAMLGITARELSPYDYLEGVKEGLLVDTVRPGTPAAESGLSRGDIITRIDGEKVASVSDIQKIIKDKKVGDSVDVTVIRYNNFGESSTIKISFALTGS